MASHRRRRTLRTGSIRWRAVVGAIHRRDLRANYQIMWGHRGTGLDVANASESRMGQASSSPGWESDQSPFDGDIPRSMQVRIRRSSDSAHKHQTQSHSRRKGKSKQKKRGPMALSQDHIWFPLAIVAFWYMCGQSISPFSIFGSRCGRSSDPSPPKKKAQP